MSSFKALISLFTDFGQVALPLTAALYSAYKKDYKGVALLITSVIVNQIGVDSLKYLFNTQRPNGGHRGFPSGHTAAAFLCPFFLMERDHLRLTNPLVSVSTLLASLVGIGRVVVKAHYPQDIVGGVLLSYSAIRFVLWIAQSKLWKPQSN